MRGTNAIERAVRRHGMAVAVLVTAAFVATSTAFALGFEQSSRGSASNVSASRSASSTHRALPTKGIGVIRLGDRFAQASGYGRYAYVIVGRGDARSARRLHGTTLAYMSGMDIARFNTGVSMSEALAHNWLLRDSAGNLITHEGYDSVYLADVGSKAYQQAWVKNVLGFLRSTRIRGVFIDDVIADPRGWTVGEILPPAYPDQASWEAAMTAFVKAVGSELKKHGYYVLLNANGYRRDTGTENSGQLDASWWRELAPDVSGFLIEYWQQNPNDLVQLRSVGTAWYQQWRGWQRLVSVAQRAGADFFGLTYGAHDDLQAMRFGKGSFMLDWNGKGGAFIFETEDGDPYNPAWAADLGKPLRPKVEVQAGVWRRRYERGLVVVNTNTAPVTVRVDGTPTTIQPTDGFFLQTHS
jgi:hypothetical protein